MLEGWIYQDGVELCRETEDFPSSIPAALISTKDSMLEGRASSTIVRSWLAGTKQRALQPTTYHHTTYPTKACQTKKTHTMSNKLHEKKKNSKLPRR